MDVVGHDDCGLQIEALSMVMETVRKNDIACWAGEGSANELAESYKQGTARLLVMRHAPPVFIFAFKVARNSHGPFQCRDTCAVSDR